MTFSEWLRARWLRPDEAVTTGLMRLSGEWGLSYKTLFYAEGGSRVSPDTAAEIEARTEGAVKAAGLVMQPQRAPKRHRAA
jgi:hypothetical protein